MNKTNFAKTATTILCAMLFIVIGSCFSAFLYKKEIVKVEDPKLVIEEGISVFNAKGDKAIEKFQLSQMNLGLKPATGEEDPESNIPTTVHDRKGSEGQFAKFKLYAPEGCSIYMSNIKITSDLEESKIKEERKNIMVAISQIKESAVSLEQDKVLVAKTSATNERVEYTFLVWLSSKISEEFDSTTISFDVLFEKV